jgi:acyl-CoA reductase-like NAD-dependent aldehyde dehydrogenase
MAAILSPITGEVLQELAVTEPGALDGVFARAGAAFGEWSSRPAAERGRILIRASELMRERIEDIAQLETLNTGKVIADTRREAERAASCFLYYGGYADKITGTVIPVPGEYHTYTRREPYGISVGIIPWNVPYFFAAKKFAPALAFGNVSILKPAAETPLTALLLASILEEAGVPRGAAQVVTGGADIGAALVSDPRTSLVVFTGSHTSGAAVAEACARRLTPVALELGGKSPQLVFEDADVDAALRGVLTGIFGACGQMCIAGSRVYVQKRLYEPFLERLARRVSELHVGDPRDPGTDIGPQATRAQQEKTKRLIAEGIDVGAQVVAQADLPSDPGLAGGFFVPPTVFVDADPASSVARQEIFGPVLVVGTFDDEDDAIRLAHETDFGLAAGIWTGDVGRAHRVAARLRAGTIWINSYRTLSDMVPFGGVGLSGYGREGGTEALGLYTWVKSVWTSTAAGGR